MLISSCLSVLAEDRLPRKPYCADNLDAGLLVRPLGLALRFPELQINPPTHQAWLTFDIDSRDAAFAWERALLPPPAWTTVNPRRGNAHLVWALEAPVCKTPQARLGPLRFLASIQAGFRNVLGADPNYGDLLTHNPTNPHWQLLIGEQRLWGLDELAGWVNLPRDGDELVVVGLGRNCTLFDELRHWSYEAIRRHRTLRYVAHWDAEVLARAVALNERFAVPLERQEVASTAQSVARWVWRKDATAAAAFSARQSAKGRLGSQRCAEVRRARTADIRTKAVRLKEGGRSLKVIAGELGVSKSCVKKWVDQARALQPKSDTSPMPGEGGGHRDVLDGPGALNVPESAKSSVSAAPVAAGIDSLSASIPGVGGRQ